MARNSKRKDAKTGPKAPTKKRRRSGSAAETKALPKHTIRSMPLNRLTAAPYNPREISDRALEGLGKSIERFGLVQPIVWNKKTGNVVGGHQRIKALEARGESRASVLVVDMPIKEERALNVALNSQAIAGDWTDDLERLLDEIQGDTPDLYGDLLLDDLRSETKATVVEDEAPEAQAEAISRTGDLWLLGDHRVLCGDSTVDGDVERVMGGEKADLVFTDPPYGVQFQGTGGDSIAGDIGYTLIPLMFAMLPGVVAEKCWLYVCGGGTNAELYARLFGRFFRKQPKMIVWDKGTITMRHNGYHSAHEMIYYIATTGAGDVWYGGRAGESAGDVWRISKPTNKDREHLTEKPVELPVRAIQHTSPVGALIFDPFLGSGTTLIAAEQLGRKCYGIEICGAYTDVIVRRWEKLTGREAHLDQNVSGRAGPGQADAGETFAEIKEKRS